MSRVAEGLREEHSPFVSFPPARSELAGPAKSKSAKASPKVCLLVLGMHYSGASTFARVLNLLGCDLPKSVVAATEASEAGRSEADALRDLNDRILASAGTRWDDWLEFHPGWLQSPRSEEFREEALTLLSEEFGSSRLFVLEDPRMCRLVPFWLGVFKAAGVQPLILSPVSSPLHVAASLETRDGFASGLGHLMWLRHVLDAEFDSRGTARFFTSYDRLMSGWARTATAASSTLGIAWPRLSDKAAVEIEALLSDDCSHDRQLVGNGLDNPTLSDWLRNTSGILGRWSIDGESEQDYAALDEIRAAMNSAAPAFSRLLSTEQVKAARLETELASERQKISRFENELEIRAEAAKAAEQKLAGERQRVSQLESELETRAEAARAAEQELAGERQKISQLDNELEIRAEAARAAEQKLAGERQKTSQLESELETRAEAAKAAARELASERQRLEQAAVEAEKSLADLRHRLAQTESSLAQRSHESEQTAGELAAAREELRQSEAARAEAEAGRAHAERVSAGLQQHLELLLADVKQRQAHAADQADTDAALARQVKQVLALLDTSRHDLATRLSAAEQARVTQAAELQLRLEEIEQARVTQAAELRQRLEEIETLKSTVEEKQRELHHERSQAERLRHEAALAIGRAVGLVDGNGKSPIRSRFRLIWQAARVKRSGLFDAQWYLRHNTDVADAGIDPLRHYIEFGAKEGRAPNPGLLATKGKA